MPKRKINSRTKGAVAEREAAAVINGLFPGAEARRGVQFKGGPESPDVKSSIDGVHFEIKRTESINVYKYLEQSIRDSGPNQVPVVLHRKNHGEWILITPFKSIRSLIEALTPYMNDADVAIEDSDEEGAD